MSHSISFINLFRYSFPMECKRTLKAALSNSFNKNRGPDYSIFGERGTLFNIRGKGLQQLVEADQAPLRHLTCQGGLVQ